MILALAFLTFAIAQPNPRTVTIGRYNDFGCDLFEDRLTFEMDKCVKFQDSYISFTCNERGDLSSVECHDSSCSTKCYSYGDLPAGFKGFCLPLMFHAGGASVNWNCGNEFGTGSYDQVKQLSSNKVLQNLLKLSDKAALKQQE